MFNIDEGRCDVTDGVTHTRPHARTHARTRTHTHTHTYIAYTIVCVCVRDVISNIM